MDARGSCAMNGSSFKSAPSATFHAPDGRAQRCRHNERHLRVDIIDWELVELRLDVLLQQVPHITTQVLRAVLLKMKNLFLARSVFLNTPKWPTLKSQSFAVYAVRQFWRQNN